MDADALACVVSLFQHLCFREIGESSAVKEIVVNESNEEGALGFQTELKLRRRIC